MLDIVTFELHLLLFPYFSSVFRSSQWQLCHNSNYVGSKFDNLVNYLFQMSLEIAIGVSEFMHYWWQSLPRYEIDPLLSYAAKYLLWWITSIWHSIKPFMFMTVFTLNSYNPIYFCFKESRQNHFKIVLRLPKYPSHYILRIMNQCIFPLTFFLVILTSPLLFNQLIKSIKSAFCYSPSHLWLLYWIPFNSFWFRFLKMSKYIILNSWYHSNNLYDVFYLFLNIIPFFLKHRKKWIWYLCSNIQSSLQLTIWSIQWLHYFLYLSSIVILP